MPPRQRFSAGIAVSVASVFELLRPGPAREWYGRALKRSFGLGAGFLFLLNAAVLASIFGATDGWASVAAAILWIIISFFLSGRLAGLFMSLAAGLWVDECGLLGVATGEKIVHLERPRLRDLGREWASAGTSALLSLVMAPLFFFPVLIPLALLPLAWALGRETVSLGLRIQRQNHMGEGGNLGKRSFLFYAGLGFLPAILSLFPILAWTGLPLLQYSGVRAVLEERPVREQSVP